MKLHYVDLEKLSKNTLGNVDLMKRLIAVFSKTAHTELSIIKEFLKYSSNPDYAKLEPHFHKLKSGLSYIAVDAFWYEYLQFYEHLVAKKYLLVEKQIPKILEKLQGLKIELEQLQISESEQV